MLQWWNSLNILEQVMATIAIPATIILIFQMIIVLFSGFGDADADFGDIDDIDIEGGDLSGIEIFTIKGFVTFFAIFGWSGLLFLRMNVNEVLSIVMAFIMGVFFMFLVALAIKGMMKLQDSGNIETKTALGVSGSVYITIPGKRTGMGKISAVVSGRYSEFDAVTDEETIPTGTSVVVVALSSTNVLVVAKK